MGHDNRGCLQRFVNRAFIGDFKQSGAGLCINLPHKRNTPFEPVDLAALCRMLLVTVSTILGVDFVMNDFGAHCIKGNAL